MSEYLKGKVAVVTGAGGTLCSVIAEDLAAKGVKVCLCELTAERAQKTADVINAAGGTCIIRACDVTDEPAVQKIADEVLEMWGPVSFVINGAGGNQMAAMTTDTYYTPASDDPEVRSFYDLDVKVIQSVLNINTVGSLIPARIFSRQMINAGIKGSIINFASMNAYCPLTRVPAYAMAKAAISNFTQWLAGYLGKAGIRVNAIAPGFFINERSAKFLGTPETGLTARGQQVINHTPMERFGEAKDLLGTVEWMLDEEKSSFISGITVAVDGAFLTRSGV